MSFVINNDIILNLGLAVGCCSLVLLASKSIPWIAGRLGTTQRIDYQGRESLSKTPHSLSINSGRRHKFSYINVKMDNVIASQNHDVLCSCDIADCVVIGVFHKYNMKTGEYAERRMAHVGGGLLQEKSNESLIKTLFERLADDASIVIAFGNNWSRDFGELTDYSGYVKKEAKKVGVAIAIAPDKWKCVYTGDPAFFGRGQSGSIKLFPNGKIASLNMNENHP